MRIRVGWTDGVLQVSFTTHPGYLNVLVRSGQVYEPNLWWRIAISKADGVLRYLLQQDGTTLFELRKRPHGTLAVLHPHWFLSSLHSQPQQADVCAAQVLLGV